jgi:surface antigen
VYSVSLCPYSAARRLSRSRPLVLAAAVSLSLCGCSYQLPSMMAVADDATASINRQPRALADTLDPEDQRRAIAAMGVALDPQGNGASVNWDNPNSGARGTFTPVGGPYPAEEGVCRAFLADIGGTAPERHLQGVGCRDKRGEWKIGDLKPWKKG